MIAGINAVADDDHKQGGSINGVENLQVLVRFVATSNAPAGATGVLRLKAHNRTNTNTTEMRITTRGLAEGTYDVTATLKSDGSTVSLGQITLTNGTGTNFVLQSESEVEIPADISALDIASVTISDGSNPLLVANILTAPGNSVSILTSRVRVTSDDPDVRGTAVLRTFAHKGLQRGNFLLVARGLAPSTTFHVFVNDTEVSTVKSSSRGAVLIRRLPGTDLTTVTSVQLRDDTSTTVAEADF
ncbi:MAG: hypothetical protein JWM68_725 [Verrucomicrobiales bacterium]|nr:hypothetical protein [Verrucomicrobiales bacterium]